MAIQTTSPQPGLGAASADMAQRLQAASPAARRETERAPVVVKDPSAMMAELAEELGFIVAEAAGGADEVDGDQDESFDDLIAALMRKSLQNAEKLRPVDAKEELRDLREQIVRQGVRGRPDRALEELLRQFTGGASQKGLALLAELVKLAATDSELQRLGFDDALLQEYVAVHEAGLTAALNLADVIAQSRDTMPDTAERMLSTYEGSIASSQSVLQTFQRLGQAEGMANVADWRAFLTEAVAADLSKQSSSTEKAQLQLILMELKGFRTFNTLTQGLDNLAKVIPRRLEPDKAQLLQSTLNYIEQPLREMPGFESLAQDLELEKQILFFQGFRNLLKSIPEDAYVSAEQKAGSLVPLQKRVDELTWSEDT